MTRGHPLKNTAGPQALHLETLNPSSRQPHKSPQFQTRKPLQDTTHPRKASRSPKKANPRTLSLPKSQQKNLRQNIAPRPVLNPSLPFTFPPQTLNPINPINPKPETLHPKPYYSPQHPSPLPAPLRLAVGGVVDNLRPWQGRSGRRRSPPRKSQARTEPERPSAPFQKGGVGLGFEV